MSTWMLAFAVLFIAMLAMAVGVLMGGKPIKGSCGGLGSSACGCSEPCPRRRNGGAS